MLTPSSDGAMRDRYINLLRDILLNKIYGDPPIRRHRTDAKSGDSEPMFTYTLAPDHSPQRRENGRDWPSVAHTMIGAKRMRNLQMICETVIKDGVEGDFIETGVWRGGACIFARGIFTAYGETARRVFVADSFEGLPAPDVDNYPEDEGDILYKIAPLAVGLEQVKANFETYDLLGDNVVFLKGWFKDTLPSAPIDKLAVLRLDGDMFESTMDGLVNLYDKVQPGGFVIVDDFGVVDGCRKAVRQFLNERGLTETTELIDIDGVGRYWRVPLA